MNSEIAIIIKLVDTKDDSTKVALMIMHILHYKIIGYIADFKSSFT